MSPRASYALLLAAPTLAALGLLLLAPPAAAQAAAPWPAHFAANESVQVGVVASGLAPAPGAQPFTVMEIRLPAGARIPDPPAPPANWTLTGEWLGEDPPRLEYTHTIPDLDDTVNFTMRVDGLPCAGDNQTLTWSLTGRRGASPADTLVAFTGQHRCDKRAPEALASFIGEATTAQASVDLLLLRDDSPLAQTAHLVAPNGTQSVLAANGPLVVLPLDANATGRWTYHVDARDAAGNAKRFPDAGSWAFTVRDATPPTLELSAPAAVEAGRRFLVFHNASDNHALATLTLAWNVTGGPPVTLDVTGRDRTELPAVSDWTQNVTVRLVALDAAGNSRESTALVGFVDTEAPTLDATLAPPNAAGWHSGDVTIRLLARDNGSPRLVVNHTLVSTRPNGTTLTHGQGGADLTLTLAGPAEHTLHFAARDDAGYATPTQTRVVRIDPATPAVTLENLTGDWRTQPVWLTLRPGATLSGPSQAGWSVDGAAQTQPSRRFALDGAYSLAWNATSPAGVRAEGDGTLRLDQTPPTLQVVLASDGEQAGFHRGHVLVTLAAADATSGVASLLVSLDNAAPTPYTGPLDVTTDGAHQLDATLTDHAGHLVRRTERFTLDRTPPLVTLTANGTADPGTRNHSALLEASATDLNGAILSCALDGSAVTLPHLVTGDGDHLAACTATDPAGNAATPVLLAFRVDAAAPTLPAWRDLGPLAAFKASLPIADASGVATVEARFEPDGIPVVRLLDAANGTWSFEGADLPDGRYNLSIRAFDAHGRSTPWTPVLGFELLTFAPSAAFQVPSSTFAGHHAPVSISWTMPAHSVPLQMLLRRADGSESVVSSPFVLGEEGVHRLSFRTRDSLGNLGAPFDVEVRVVPPAKPAGGSGAGAGGSAGTTGATNRAPLLAGVSLVLEGDRALAATRGAEDPDGDAVTLSYAWRVDDAAVPGAQGPTLRVSPGQQVQVRVTPSDGKLQGAAVESAVLIVPAAETPAARFGLSGDARAGATLAFDASASRLAVAYRWVFSDGTMAEGVRVERVFAQPGDAWAQLTVVGADGATATTRRDFTLDPAPAPAVEFRHVASDGQAYVLEGQGDVLTVERELPGTRFLVRGPDGLLLWDPADGSAAKVAEVAATPGGPDYALRAQVTPVAFAADGWTLVTLADPLPTLALESIAGPDGGPVTWWREGDIVHALARDGALELRHALPALALHVDTVEGADGQWTLTLTATGGGPLASLRLLQGDEAVSEGLARTLTASLRPEGNVTYRAVAVTADGQEASREVTLAGRDGEREDGDGRDGLDEGNPVPGFGLMLLLGVMLGVATIPRRR